MGVDAALVMLDDSDRCPKCGKFLERQVTTGDPGDGVSFSFCFACGSEWRQEEFRGRLLFKRRVWGR